MVIVCKICYTNISISKEEIDVNEGEMCCIKCGNIINVGLLYYFSKICKDIKARYKKSGFKVTNVKVKHKPILQHLNFNDNK